MPFGLYNAPATFQRLMDTVLMGLNFDICLAYLDNIIVYSSDLHQSLGKVGKTFSTTEGGELEIETFKKARFFSRLYRQSNWYSHRP